MKLLLRKTLVLLIALTMMLSGSFVQAFAAEETPDSSSVVQNNTEIEDDGDPSAESDHNVGTTSPDTDKKEEVTSKADSTPDSDAQAKEAQDEPEKAAVNKPETDAENNDSATDVKNEDAFGTLKYKGDGYTVTLEYGKKAGLPDGTKLEVREILADSEDKAENEEYKEYHDQTLDALKQERAEDKDKSEDIASLKFARFFDITLMSDGKEIEPAGDVSVKIEFDNDSREEIAKADDAEKNLRVVHIEESKKSEHKGEIEVTALDNKDTDLSIEKKELAEASFTTDSFSVYGIVYTIDFEYDTKQAEKTETVVEAKGKTFRMEAAYDTDAGIPAEGVRLSAKELKDDDPDAVTFDIKIVSESDESIVYQPAEGHNVALTVVVLDKKADADEDTASVLHVSEDGTEEMLTADIEATDEGYVYSFETESFSTFTFYRSGTNSNERFITTVKTGRFGGTPTELSGSARISNDDATGWLSFDEVINKWNSSYSYSRSNGRYSVLKANDNGNGNRKQALSAVGFFDAEVFVGLVWVPSHVALGRYATSADVNGSATSYDLQIELNDNSLPVRITANGTTTNTVFVPSDNATSFTPESIAEKLGYNTDDMVVSGEINNMSTDSVSRAQLTTTDIPTVSSGNGWWSRLLAGETFESGAGDGWISGNRVSYPATSVTYPAAYKWTYNNGGTQTVIGDTPYEIKIIPAVAQVSNDGGATWKKFACLISGEYDGEQLVGAFDYANSLTGDVIVEMLYDEHERYTLSSGFIFNNSDITSLTINGVDIDDTDKKTTLVKNQTDAPMITTNGIGTVGFNQIIFNGNNKKTSVVDLDDGMQDPNGKGSGGAVKTNAATLNVSNCEFVDCQASRQGGGIYHYNTDDNVACTIEDSTFTSCRANGPGSDQEKPGGGGGVITSAQSLTVSNCTFDSCTTAARQGAGLFQKRSKDAPESTCTVTKCDFTDCVAVHGGGGMESDAWNTTVTGCEFTRCLANKSKGGAINVWADGQDNTSKDTSLTVTGCKFNSCTSGDNGGAIRSTALETNITGSTFEECSSANGNGGAVASTNNRTQKTFITCTDCTFKDCHADGTADKTGNGGAIFSTGSAANATIVRRTTIDGCFAKKSGGAIRSGTLLIDGGTITNCTAGERGGAVHSGQTITMTSGTVTGCTTGGNNSAALDADAEKPGFCFSGDVVIAGNTGSGGEARDVYLGLHNNNDPNKHTDQHIQIDRPGLGSNASIGVYVPSDTAEAFNYHGKPGQPFARSSGVKAITLNNLDKLFSDRLDNGPMRGKAATSGESYEYRIMWSAYICKIVDDNGEHPFDTLRGALAFARGNEITTSMSASNPVKIEMLVDYVIPKNDNVTLDQATDNIIITTAATSGGEYNFKPTFTEEQGRLPEDSKSIAILQRGWNQSNNAAEALFYINNDAKFTTENIVLDGRSKVGTETGLTQKTGRAIYVNNGSLSATGDTTIRNFNMNADGGAVYAANDLTYTVSDTGNLLFDNCSTTKNGGAIYAAKALTLTPEGTATFTSCSANNGGGIYQAGTGELTLTNVTFGKAGDEDKGCFAEVEGGSVYSYGKNTTITDCDFYYSKAGSGENNNNTHGGAVCHDGTDAEHQILGCVFDHCSANTRSNEKSHGNGGAVFIEEHGNKLIIDQSENRRSSFTDCNAYRYGGAVIFEMNDRGGIVSVSNSDFEDCYTTYMDGGAVYSDSDTTSFEKCTFKGCHSDSTSGDYDGGGAIYMNGDTPSKSSAITIKDCQFEDCYVSKNGGAIHFYSTGTNATLNNVQITGAKAGLGSAVYSKGDLKIINGEIKNCKASNGDGGAVNLGSGKKVEFEGSAVVYDNKGTGSLSEQQKNVVLDWTREHNQTIWTTSNGITEQAHIGVYVTGTTTGEPFKSHGGYLDDFGTYANTDAGKANLDRFINDRVKDANGVPLYGELCPDHTGNRWIRWTGYYNVAPTAVNQNYLPYILILVAGAALAAIAVIARRRRAESANEDDE